MKGKVIILNAPPNAGKDTIAAAICEITGAEHREFKDELYRCTAEYFKLELEWYIGVASDRATKDDPCWNISLPRKEYFKLLDAKGTAFDSEDRLINEGWDDVNISPREALIYTSECVYKPQHGSMYFGQQTAKGIDLGVGAVYSDGGFDDELLPIISKVGAENVYVVKFTREGADTFEGDSRNWLNVPVGVAWYYTSNDKTVADLTLDILEWLQQCDTDKGNEEFKVTTFGEL